jgi:hypothetical protein
VEFHLKAIVCLQLAFVLRGHGLSFEMAQLKAAPRIPSYGIGSQTAPTLVSIIRNRRNVNIVSRRDALPMATAVSWEPATRQRVKRPALKSADKASRLEPALLWLQDGDGD